MEVPGFDLADPEHPEETTVKLWVGFLHEELQKDVTPGNPEEPGALDFGEELGTRVQPSAASLVEIADEHFKFVTAQSGAPEAPKKPTAKKKGKGAMETRVSSLEETLKSIQETLQDLPMRMQDEREAPKAVGGAKTKSGSRPAASSSVQVQGLDPAVVAAARGSGLSEAHLTRLGQMFARPERMAEPALRKKRVQLSSHLKQELLLCVALLALSVIDMRLKPSKYIVASDASSKAEAAVRAEVGEQRMRELQRHGLQKGLWSRLLSPAKAFQKERGMLEEDEELPDCSYEMHPLWEKISTSLQFERFGPITRVKGRRHINIGEVSAALSAEKLQGLSEPNSFYVHLQDSQVSLACLVKGRSASPGLNRLLRRSIPYHISSNNRAHYGFLRSKFNPADDPTRDVEVRRPLSLIPCWWEDVNRGDFEEFDSFLRAGLVHPMQIAELPDPREQSPDACIDWRTSSQIKKERGAQMKKTKKRDQEGDLKLSPAEAEDVETANRGGLAPYAVR